MEKRERVILIKGDESKWYEQAIFIVNQDIPQSKIPVDFVAEAEKIIHNHVRKKYDKNYGNKVGIAYTSPTSSAVATRPAVKPKAKMQTKKSAKKKHFDYVLNTIMAIGCFVIAAVIMLNLWG